MRLFYGLNVFTGYNAEDLETKYAKYRNVSDNSVDQLTNNMAQLNQVNVTFCFPDSSKVNSNCSSFQPSDNNAVFDAIAADHKTLAAEVARNEISFKIKTGDDEEGQVCEALLSGNIEAAVELCFNAGRHADAIIIAGTGTA